MGMDVYGNNGGYFRRNVWSWHPLAELVCDLAPDETEGCTDWHTNDGDGLGAEASVLLANRLQSLIDDGTVERYVKDRDARLAALRDKSCIFCSGTGIRRYAVGVKMGKPKRVIGERTDASDNNPKLGETGSCNGCNGKGHVRPGDCLYFVELADVIEFVAFLRESGGFEIC